MSIIRVGVLFGGRSGEYEVSLLSAASVIEELRKNKKYEVLPIAITREGRWICFTDAEILLCRRQKARLNNYKNVGSNPVLVPLITRNSLKIRKHSIEVDIIFPVMHGIFGEDGTIQGLLEIADIPYVGASVLGSAAGMDKDVMKRLFREAGLPTVKHIRIYRHQWNQNRKRVSRIISEALRYPVFVKPANSGSSLGITKVREPKELGAAVDEAVRFDKKIVIEESVGGKSSKAREIECSVIGNDKPIASLPGEIVPEREFYDYQAKYHDQRSMLLIPAPLTKAQKKKVMHMAVEAFLAVEGCGLGRIDFLMDPLSKSIFINEINTMPGFTPISMYPKLWAASGISYGNLLDRLIRLGFERYHDKKNVYCP
jgi:D-alanine-D-alanine ligase